MNIFNIKKLIMLATGRHRESCTQAVAIHPSLDCRIASHPRLHQLGCKHCGQVAMTGAQNKIEDAKIKPRIDMLFRKLYSDAEVMKKTYIGAGSQTNSYAINNFGAEAKYKIEGAKIKPRADTPSERSEVEACEHGFDLRRKFQINFCTPNQVFFVTIVSFLFLLFPNFAHAQTLRISPALLKIELSPGKTTTQEFLVDNLTNNPLPVKINVEGFDSNDEDFGIKVAEKITTPLADWISLDTTDTIIPAKTQTKITATINVPTEVPLGGYYAVIFFDPLPNPADLNIQGNQINARLGAITLASIGVANSQNEAEIITFTSDKSFYNSDLPQLTLRAKNTGLNFFTAKPSLVIDPLIGKTTTIDWEEKTILPGKIRRWEKQINLPNNYSLFSKITVNLSLENGQFVSKSFTVYSFPVQKSLLLTILFIILSIMLKNRSRLLKSLKVLFSSK